MASFNCRILFIAMAAFQLRMAMGIYIYNPNAVSAAISQDPENECVTFNHHYCSRFGYTTTLSPNPRNLDVQLASVEFDHFLPLLNTECSDVLGTLLCFLYFPFCQTVGSKIEVVYPCREICEEVTNLDSKCTEELKRFNLTWGPHFNCSHFTYKDTHVYQEEKCAKNKTVTTEETSTSAKWSDETVTTEDSSTTAGQIMTVPSEETKEDKQCVTFENHYCNRFGYTTTYFPNPRQQNLHLSSTEEYKQNAIREFNDFFPLLETGCSSKLPILLCFFYFPLCEVGQCAYPCRSLCEEVTGPDSECTKILNGLGFDWPEQFNCTHYQYKNKNLYIERDPVSGRGLCVNGNSSGTTEVTDTSSNSGTTEVTDTSSNSGTTEVTDTSSNSGTTEVTDTSSNSGTTEVNDTSSNLGSIVTDDNSGSTEITTATKPAGSCSNNCRYRKNAGRSTFKNNDYNFCARVRLNNFLPDPVCGRHAMNCTLLRQFNIKSRSTCRSAPELEEGSSFILYGYNAACDNCHRKILTPGTEYLIGGHFFEVQGTVYYTADGNRGRPLISKCVNSKCDDNKISRYVDNGNSIRQC